MKKDNDLKVIEETSKIINDIEKGFYEILANNTMRICTTYEQELAKYKRAFEILIRELNIQIFYDDECCEPMWVLDGGGNKEITKEEYELLEELMKDDN